MLSYVKNGLLRTRWDHTAAATGRLTSACPNLQAVPRLPVTIQPLPDHRQWLLFRVYFISYTHLCAARFTRVRFRLCFMFVLFSSQ